LNAKVTGPCAPPVPQEAPRIDGNLSQTPPAGSASKRKQLSGHQKRKLAEARKREAGINYVPPPPPLGPLEQPVHYRRELNEVYRRMRLGHLPPEIATKSAFILNLGAALAKAEQELAELAQLREAVAQIQDGNQPAIQYGANVERIADCANGADQVHAVELVPASDEVQS
jgi:hypothetical protein